VAVRLVMKKEIPVVVYVHCEAGKDRTGMVSALYYLKHLKWGLKEVIRFNIMTPPERDISPDMLNEVIWFCYYLKVKLGYDIDCNPY